MFTKEMMIRIHEIARELEGHFYARLALAFRIYKEENSETALTGTAKQVAWATKIKKEMLETAGSFSKRARTNKSRKVFEAIYTSLEQQENSVFFIENRDFSKGSNEFRYEIGVKLGVYVKTGENSYKFVA